MKIAGLGVAIAGLALVLYWADRPQTIQAASSSLQGSPLQREVPSFVFDRLPAIDAVLLLGQQEGIPLGIEYLSCEAIERPMTLRMGRARVEEILEALLPREKGYAWEVQQEVIVIRHQRVPPPELNLLDRVLPEFAVPRTTVQHASGLLAMALFREVYPLPPTHGFVNLFEPDETSNAVGPFELRQATARQALNRIVSENRNAAWIVKVKPEHMNQLYPERLWIIMEYQTPTRRVSDTPRYMVFGRECSSSTGKTE